METREIGRRFVTASDIVSVERHFKGTVFMQTQSQTETTPIVKSAQNLYEIVKGDVIAAAEIMPESGYSLKIDPEVRSFGQQVAHIADTIYLFASSCLGESNPFPGVTPVEAGVLEKTKATKSDIVNVLKSSFAYCDRAFTSASDTALVKTVGFS